MGNFDKFLLIVKFFCVYFTRTFAFKYCDKWDKQLNYLLDTYSEVAVTDGGCTVRLGDFYIWVGGSYFPHCTGSLMRTGSAITLWKDRRRPSLKTLIRLMELPKSKRK